MFKCMLWYKEDLCTVTLQYRNVDAPHAKAKPNFCQCPPKEWIFCPSHLFHFSFWLVFEQPSLLTPSSTVHKAPNLSTPELRAKPEAEEEKGKELDDLRTQIKELLLSVELLKTQQT